MKIGEFRRLEDLFDAAAELPADRRHAYLEKACGEDRELLGLIERMLHRLGDNTADLHPEVEVLLARRNAESGTLDTRAPKPLDVALRPGDRVGHYVIREQIGEGGFGAVYRAEQERPIRRTVALKIIKLGMDTKQVIARFEAERQALAMMDHPYIARVFDAGATDTGRPYFAMELVEGVPVTAYCDQQRLGLNDRLDLFRLVCQAMQHAHQKGIIHRDLKPSNVLVTGNGTPVPKVIDFGIAKAMNQRLTERTLVTESGQLVGTPAYMSPEQAGTSGGDIDTRSDIYSLGVLLYELLTSTTPFDSTALRSAPYADIERVIREQEPLTPSSRLGQLGQSLADVAQARRIDPDKLSRRLRGDLDWIVMRALEKERNRRYQTASELAADVHRYLNHEAVLARPPSAAYRIRKFVRRHRLGVAAGAMVTAALVAGATLAAVGFARASRDRDLATERLWESYLAQAQAGRFSDRPGRRFDGLEALRAAAAIRPSLELRNEAIACLTLSDVKIERYFDEPSAVASATGLKEIDRFARGTDDGRITIVSIDDGRELIHLEGPPLRVVALLFSPDGRYLAAKYHTGNEISLWVWDLTRAHPVLKLEGGEFEWGDFVFGGDSNWVAVGQSDERIHVYDLPSGTSRRTLPPGSAPSRCWLSAHPREPKLAVSTKADPPVTVWDLEIGVVVTTMSAPSLVRQTAWRRDGGLLAGGCADQNVYIWESETGRLQRTLVGHQGEVIDVSFDPGGDLLASFGWDNTTRLWSVGTGEQILEPLMDWQLRGFGGRLATMRSTTAEFGVWHFEPGREHRRLYAASKLGISTRVSIGPQGRLLASAGPTGVRLWDLAQGRELAVLREEAATNPLMLPDGGGLAVIADGNLMRWPLRLVGDVVHVGDPMVLWSQEPLVSGRVSADGRTALLCTAARMVVFDLNEQRERMTTSLPFGGTRPSISPDGRWLFIGAWQHEVAGVRDLRSGQTVCDFPGGDVSGAFSPDGRALVVSSRNALRFYEPGTWTVYREITRPGRGRTPEVTFSPDGTIVALAQSKFEVQLVAVETGEPVATLWSPEPYLIANICFSPDGGTLAAATPDRAIQIWDLRLIREGLRELGLDWDQPPLSAPATADGSPLRVVFTTDDRGHSEGP